MSVPGKVCIYGNISLSLSLILPLCVRACERARACVYTDGNTTPEEVRRFSVCVSRLPALRQGREKLQIRFQTAAAWIPDTTRTQRSKTRTHASHTAIGAEERAAVHSWVGTRLLILHTFTVCAFVRNGDTEAHFHLLFSYSMKSDQVRNFKSTSMRRDTY